MLALFPGKENKDVNDVSWNNRQKAKLFHHTNHESESVTQEAGQGNKENKHRDKSQATFQLISMRI